MAHNERPFALHIHILNSHSGPILCATANDKKLSESQWVSLRNRIVRGVEKEMQESEGNGQVPSLLAERAA